jgi:hypothetical protein
MTHDLNDKDLENILDEIGECVVECRDELRSAYRQFMDRLWVNGFEIKKRVKRS